MSAIGSDGKERAGVRSVVALLLLQFSAGNPAADEEGIRLSLTPRLCVMEKAQESCFTVVRIQWLARVPLSACIHRHDQDVPLHCWRSVQEGELDVAVESGADLVFELRSVEGGQTLAEAALQVVQENEVRRRRRNPWTFF